MGIKVVKVPLYESGHWDVPEEDAKSLVGGNIHFHETKGEPSYFGGIVTGFRILETKYAHSRRVIFRFESTLEAKGKLWAGIDHINAHYSGIVN